MTDADFDPEDMAEIEKRFREVLLNQGEQREGYELVFFITDEDAMDLLASYEDAARGNALAMAKCWREFSKIMRRLQDAVTDGEDY